MPILTLQQRLREIGRIRMGQKGDRGQPQKLSTWRFTSREIEPLETIAKLYGGKVVKCDEKKSPDLKGHWEVITDRNRVPFYPGPLPPSQYMECWSGGGCTRRCDGRTEALSGESCLCDPDAPECKPTTRLSVILPDAPGLGVWRLETKGWNAAAELVASYELLKGIIGANRFVEAWLGMEERVSRKAGKTNRFMVPTIQIGSTPREMIAAMEAQENPELPTGAPALNNGAQQLPPRQEPVPVADAEADHILKDPNPRGGYFAIIKEMGLPAHEGRTKELYYEVLSAVLRTEVTSLSDLTEDQWRKAWGWIAGVHRGEKAMPKAFKEWLAGTHSSQQHDPMAEEPEPAPNPTTQEPTDVLPLEEPPAPTEPETSTTAEARAAYNSLSSADQLKIQKGLKQNHQKLEDALTYCQEKGILDPEKLIETLVDPFFECTPAATA